MKALYVCIVCSLLFTNFNVFSQQKAAFEVGKPYEVINARNRNFLVNNDNVIGFKDKLIQLFSVSKNTLINTTEYELPKDAVEESKIKINDKLYIFYSLWDKQLNIEQLFYDEINPKIENNVVKGKLLFSVNGKVTGTLAAGLGLYNFIQTEKFQIFQEHNDSVLLIKYKLVQNNTNDNLDNDVIGFKVFDLNFNQIVQKEIKIPYLEKTMDYLDFAIDRKNNIYILSRIFNDKSKKWIINEKTNFRLEVIRIDANKSNFNKIPITYDKQIDKLNFYEYNSDYILCIGFTKNNIDLLNNAEGIVVFKISNDGVLSEVKHYSFPLEIIQKYVSEKTLSKNENVEENNGAELYNLQLKDALIQKDGSIILVSEQSRFAQGAPQKGSVTSPPTHTFCGPIIFTKINNDGTLAYFKKIPKSQNGIKVNNSLSYKYMVGEKCHYLIFFDNIKNQKLSPDKIPIKYIEDIDANLVAYKIDDISGNSERFSVLDLKNINGMEVYQFSVDRIIPISLNTFLLEAYKKQKEDVLIKVNLP